MNPLRRPATRRAGRALRAAKSTDPLRRTSRLWGRRRVPIRADDALRPGGAAAAGQGAAHALHAPRASGVAQLFGGRLDRVRCGRARALGDRGARSWRHALPTRGGRGA
ncbi:hypothetical protein PAHAL_1G446100 [Panicum hallii]|uniref:Uncharacterized protein n=1 Tax=Panicum hallii TaxID=206008 RepID=A0A2T8KYD6_9POAL|nr:hypothetical protein PAHAL_1G446100 [Panicum hallii]